MVALFNFGYRNKEEFFAGYVKWMKYLEAHLTI
jgi:hypothetical protein